MAYSNQNSLLPPPEAQQELLKMDILVCGGCHSTFHYVGNFEEHKENCKGTLNKPKPESIKQNWAFLLWKASQGNALTQNSWKLYQSWTQLDARQQAAWITAGQSIQTISRLGTGNVQETQVKVMRTMPKAEADAAEAAKAKIEPVSDLSK